MVQAVHHHDDTAGGAHSESQSCHCHHGHSHGTENADTRRLWLALFVIGGFAIIEVIGGFLSNSLALLADAGHMVTDAMAIALAIWARTLAKAPATATLPYGRTRAQVLAAFVNGLALFVLIIVLLGESIERFSAPEAINTNTMLLIAFIGLLANLAAFGVLHSGSHDDINIRGAVLHVIGDLLGSVAAIVSALIIMTTGWLLADPIVTLLVCALIARSAFYLTKDAAHILLQGAPRGLDVEVLKERLLSEVGAFKSIHDLKVWMLTPDKVQLTMHARIRPEADANVALHQAKTFLVREYGIEASIIQIEVKRRSLVSSSIPNSDEDPCPDETALTYEGGAGRSATPHLHS